MIASAGDVPVHSALFFIFRGMGKNKALAGHTKICTKPCHEIRKVSLHPPKQREKSNIEPNFVREVVTADRDFSFRLHAHVVSV